MSSVRSSFGFVACLALLTGCSGRSDFPDQPIVLVCPWSAGGGTDAVSRQVAALLEIDLGVPVNVVNATGGSGVTGHTRGSLARPDGYTVTMTTVELNMLHWRGLTNITYHEFEPLMLLNRDDAALFVRADASWKSIEDLESAIRAKPGGLKASGTAQGGIWHLALAGWLDAVGLKPSDALWISINGAGPSLQELMSGGVDVVCCSLPEAQALLDSGRIRALGVMSAERLEAYPDVPTFREQGADWAMGGWRGLMLPLGVPEDRVETLLAAIERVTQRKEYLAFMESSGFDHSAARPADFEALLELQDAQFGEILTSDAFRAVQKSRYGPMTFPAILGGLFLVAATALAITGAFRRRSELPALSRQEFARIGLATAWVVAFIALLEPLGFVLTAAILLLAMMIALKVRLRVAVPVVAVLVPATYQIFAVALRVPLPWGLLGW